MDMRLFIFSLILFLALATPVRADWCSDANTLSTNVSVNSTNSLVLTNVSVDWPCPAGCDSVRGICKENFFGIDLLLFLFFEGVAFGFLMLSILRVKSAYSLFPPLIACMLFFILAWLAGFITTNGELSTSFGALWINLGLGCITILFIIDSMFEETKENFDEHRGS